MWPLSTTWATRFSAPAGMRPVASSDLKTSAIAAAEFTSAETCVTWTPSICSVPSDFTFCSQELGFTFSSGAFLVGGVPCLRGLDDLGPGRLRDRVADVPAREPGAVAGGHEAALAVEARERRRVTCTLGLRHLLRAGGLERAARA